MTDEGSGLNESFTLCLLKARERLRERQREDRKNTGVRRRGIVQ